VAGFGIFDVRGVGVGGWVSPVPVSVASAVAVCVAVCVALFVAGLELFARAVNAMEVDHFDVV
jgi:hypothetical protein